MNHQNHSHEMIFNSLFYDIHKKRQLDYVKAMKFIKTYRASDVIYKKLKTILNNITKK